MSETLPTVSVIIPAYNAAEFVGRAIESVLNQTCPPLEILVVDDGSKDNTAEVVAAFPPPVRLIRQENGGPASARNRGAREARGEWLGLLDADDSWLPRKLERQLLLARDPDVAVIHCLSERPQDNHDPPDVVTFERLWQGNCILNTTALVRKSVFESLGGFDEDRELISVEDYNLWLRIAAAGHRIVTCQEPHIRYTPAPGSLSQQSLRFAKAELINLGKIAALHPLPAERVRAKEAAICLGAGKDLLNGRDLISARRFFWRAMRLRPARSTLALLLAAWIPAPVLDWRRRRGGALQRSVG